MIVKPVNKSGGGIIVYTKYTIDFNYKLEQMLEEEEQGTYLVDLHCEDNIRTEMWLGEKYDFRQD
jgi:hypothetical protein